MAMHGMLAIELITKEALAFNLDNFDLDWYFDEVKSSLQINLIVLSQKTP